MGVDYPTRRYTALPERVATRTGTQLFFLASRRRLGGRRCLGGVAENRLQGTDFDNGALAASGNDRNGTNSHGGSSEQFDMGTKSMHSIQGNIAACFGHHY